MVARQLDSELFQERKKEQSLKNVKNFNTPEMYKEASISKIYKTVTKFNL